MAGISGLEWRLKVLTHLSWQTHGLGVLHFSVFLFVNFIEFMLLGWAFAGQQDLKGGWGSLQFR